MIQQRGCAYRSRLRPSLEAVFLGPKAEIRALLAASEVKFLSQHRLVRLSLPEDLLTCAALSWSDGDHFSNAGEARFGKRMRVIENARAAHGV